VLNTWLQPTAFFQLNPDLRLDLEAELRPIRRAVAEDRLHGIDATTIALKLLGNSIGANFFLVGYALQAGGLPLSLAAIERAIELNGQAVEFNKRALALGRLAAHDRAAVERQLDAASGQPAVAPPRDLDALVRRRVEYLTEYQDAAYAARYAALVERVRVAERERGRGLSGLAEAVAQYYFKVLAYKDEYEVARLHATPAFRNEIERTFQGDFRLRFHLAPPLLTRPDPKTGRTAKREFGQWMLPVFGVLARLKGLRGTALDVFGYTEERKLDRRLVAEYEALVEELLQGLNASSHATCVELASLPEHVRGFGPVKQRHLETVRKRQGELLAKLRRTGSEAAAA
jgi:indolepyruvate ferredoxin oxidoreductase